MVVLQTRSANVATTCASGRHDEQRDPDSAGPLKSRREQVDPMNVVREDSMSLPPGLHSLPGAILVQRAGQA
jgi:hypothetical protein